MRRPTMPVEHTADERGEERWQWRASRNLPPLTGMDVLGIVVAVVGTLALIILAAVTAAGDDGGIGFVSAARILIALGAALINLAHVVAIFLFESVDYHGRFQRFFAKLSLFGTPLALLVSIGIGLF
jgi:hypothetical protein